MPKVPGSNLAKDVHKEDGIQQNNIAVVSELNMGMLPVLQIP